MERDLKLQNEVKIKTAHINQDESEFVMLKEIVNLLFGNIDFNPGKDWNISFNIKNTDEGLRNFSGSLKMTDRNITGEQLSIFTDYSKLQSKIELVKDKFQNNMQNIVDGDSGVQSISISGSGFPETVVAKKQKV